MFRRGGARFAVVAAEKRIEIAESQADERMPDAFLRYAHAIENAATVMTAYGVPSETKVDFGALQEDAEKLQMLAVVAKPRGQPFSTIVTFSPGEDPPRTTDSAAVVNVSWVTFGERALLVIVAVVGKPQWETRDDGVWRMTVSAEAPQPRLTRAFSVADAKKLKVRPLLDGVMRELEAEGAGIVVGPPGRKSD